MTEPTVIEDGIEAMIVRPVFDPHGGRTPMVHVAWRLPPHASNAAVQVYVDDQLVRVETDPRIGETWLSLDPFGSQRIDLQAVDAADPDATWTAWPPSEGRPNDRIEVQLLRDKALPIDTQVTFSVDGETIARQPMWGPDDVRGGFGSLFGLGSFGIDAASAVGLGVGPLGVDVLDADSSPLCFRWSPPGLPAGTASVTAAFTDRNGHAVANDSTLDIEVDRLASPPRNLRLASNTTLAWTT